MFFWQHRTNRQFTFFLQLSTKMTNEWRKRVHSDDTHPSIDQCSYCCNSIWSSGSYFIWTIGPLFFVCLSHNILEVSSTVSVIMNSRTPHELRILLTSYDHNEGVKNYLLPLPSHTITTNGLCPSYLDFSKIICKIRELIAVAY